MKTAELFDLSNTIAKDFLSDFEYPWESLGEISSFVVRLGEELNKKYPGMFYSPSECVWIAKTADVAPTSVISAPSIIDSCAEIRHNAFIRGSVIVGKSAVVGNSSELKNAILFDGVQVPHFNYAGDSILGYKSHMGAGAIISNLKADKSEVVISKTHHTNRAKIGAFLGDFAEIGCGCVLCPGSVIGKNSSVYPLSCVRGTVPENSIFKSPKNIIKKVKSFRACLHK